MRFTEKQGFIESILLKVGNPELLSQLSSKLSMSELNSLLLEVYRAKAKEMNPPDLLRQYSGNRFVLPAKLSPIVSYRYSADLLEAAEKYGYTALDLSPVSVLGSCSVIAQVDQNKVLSALRGTEVLSDATNALALHICAEKKKKNAKTTERLRYCAIHRHLRAQKFSGSNQYPHFILYCTVISGRDEGNLKFEKESLVETFTFYQEYLRAQGFLENIRFIIWPRPGDKKASEKIYDYLRSPSENTQFYSIIKEEPSGESGYYKDLQFKIMASYKDKEYEIGDGGFVDWPQKLLQDKKERMLISAIGLERLIMITRDQ
jgi:hypothetical protein